MIDIVKKSEHGLDGCHYTLESRYSQDLSHLTHVMIRWSPGMKFQSVEKILEETESVLLNLGKCSKLRMQKRAEKPSQREVYRCAE